MALTQANIDELLDGLKYDEQGFVTALVVDAAGGALLMTAKMNRQALRDTLQSGKMHYWSRSRAKQWLKGETSGHFQIVREVRIDCDGDALLFKVEQKGGACHTGYFSCFYRKLGPEGWVTEGVEKVFDPEAVYK